MRRASMRSARCSTRISPAAAFASRRRTRHCRLRASACVRWPCRRHDPRRNCGGRAVSGSERSSAGIPLPGADASADGDSAGNARDSVFAAVGWALARDIRVALRSKGELGVQLLFYVIVVSLFPLATSPSREVLATIGPGVLWTAALLASLLSLSRLFASDFHD